MVDILAKHTLRRQMICVRIPLSRSETKGSKVKTSDKSTGTTFKQAGVYTIYKNRSAVGEIGAAVEKEEVTITRIGQTGLATLHRI